MFRPWGGRGPIQTWIQGPDPEVGKEVEWGKTLTRVRIKVRKLGGALISDRYFLGEMKVERLRRGLTLIIFHISKKNTAMIPAGCI